MKVLTLAVALAACSSPATPLPTNKPATTTELSPALAPLAWWLGDWDGDLGSEHWVAAGGAIYGIALLRDGGFEVMIVDDGDGNGPADGVLRFIAMPGGARSVEFIKESMTATEIKFANPTHDSPKKITYERTDEGLRAWILVEVSRTQAFNFAPGPRRYSPELEAADRAFSDDTGKRGVEGWLAAFAPNGAMMRNGERVERAAIAEMMKPTLESGTLAWAPIASGRAGKLGFTVGKGTFTGKTPADGWKSSYVSIWQQQPDGAWKVVFDVGRPVNAPDR